MWLELKYGRTTQAGVVRYHVRPIQRLQMNRLLRLGVEVGVLVGSDEGQVWVLQAVPEAFEGRLDVRGSLPKWSRAVEDRKSLLKVVNFGYLSPDVHPKLLRA